MTRDNEEVCSLPDFEGASALVSRPPLQLGKCALTKTDSFGFQIPSSMCYMHCTHQSYYFISSVSQLVDASLSQHLGSHWPYTSSLHVITLLLYSIARVPNCPQNKIRTPGHDFQGPSQSAHHHQPRWISKDSYVK